jgi:hypothetical protein
MKFKCNKITSKKSFPFTMRSKREAKKKKLKKVLAWRRRRSGATSLDWKISVFVKSQLRLADKQLRIYLV